MSLVNNITEEITLPLPSPSSSSLYAIKMQKSSSPNKIISSTSSATVAAAVTTEKTLAAAVAEAYATSREFKDISIASSILKSTDANSYNNSKRKISFTTPSMEAIAIAEAAFKAIATINQQQQQHEQQQQFLSQSQQIFKSGSISISSSSSASATIAQIAASEAFDISSSLSGSNLFTPPSSSITLTENLNYMHNNTLSSLTLSIPSTIDTTTTPSKTIDVRTPIIV